LLERYVCGALFGVLIRDATDRAEVNAVTLAVLWDGNAGHESPALERVRVEVLEVGVGPEHRFNKLFGLSALFDKEPVVLVADLTGDGRADIVGFGNRGVSVSLNTT
jgi:hypothetical protein